MANTIIVRETFASRDEAERARERLEHGGFSRHTIAIVPSGNHVDLAVHTRPEYADRVKDCIEGSDLIIQAKRYVREFGPSAGQSLLLIWAVGATAVALGYALKRNHDQWLEDTSNIDRRWDRADRLADTSQEDQRWHTDRRPEGGQGFGAPGLNRDSVGYGA